MQLPRLTKLEQDALIEAMKQNFGACTCRNVNGAVMFCDGHRFLSEAERFGTAQQMVDRVTRLTMYRRMASFWTSREFSRPFALEPTPMLEPDPLPPDLIPPTQPVPRESPQQGDDTDRLPW